MKKILCIIFLLFSFFEESLAAEIKLRADIYPPFNSEPKSELPGYMIEVSKIVFERAGHKIDYQIAPWNRSIKDAEVGAIDGIVGAAKGDAPGFIFHDEPLGRVVYTVFVRKDSNYKLTNIESLASQKLSIISDYSYGASFDKYINDNETDKNKIDINVGDDALPQSVKKLQLSRVTAVLSTPQVFYETLKELQINREEFNEAGSSADTDDFYIAFSPKKDSSKKYAEILSSGIVELRQSGELQKILDKYQLKDWK